MNIKILICSFLLASCAGEDTLTKICPLFCYTGPRGTENVGQCQEGTAVCDENLNVTGCDGEVLPEFELCDGLDNNCDGQIDDGYIGREFSAWSFFWDVYPCKTTGVCIDFLTQCRGGKWRCNYPPAFEEVEKTCDGRDNDCDGFVDEDVLSDMPVSERFCYSGVPEESALNPPCRPGVLQCVGGHFSCQNQVLPSSELCDGIDNDCDGIADNTPASEDHRYDIVFAIDRSGSMCDNIVAVASACNRYASQFDGNLSYKFAIISFSSKLGDPLLSLIEDFADFSVIRNTLSSMTCDLSTGTEASLDAIYYLCDKQRNYFNLSYTVGAVPAFFLFTDEPAQSYTLSPAIMTQDMIDTCSLNGVLPFMWTADTVPFEEISVSAGGAFFPLVNDPQAIFEDMNSIIQKFCGG